jgi:hypothetical protein
MSGSVLQSGSVAAGHVATWLNDGTVIDGGTAGNGAVSELGITNPGGLALGINSGVITAPYTQFGVSVAQNGIATFSLNSFNGAPDPTLQLDINGVIYAFNPSLNGNITGPETAGSGNLLSFNGTVGNIVQDSSISAMGGAFGQIATAFFYESQGAKINRLNDRLLLGAAATVQDGNNPPSPLTWVGQQAAKDYTYLDSLSQFEVISTIGGVAGAFAARSSDILPDTWTGCFGIVSLGLNDSPLGLEAWGIYAPAFMADASAFYTAGVETDVCAADGITSATSNAYLAVPSGLVTGISVAAGNEYGLVGPVSPASAAISIFPAAAHDAIAGTGGLFRKGIVFQADVLDGCDGSTGKAIAIEMGKGQQLVWKSDLADTAVSGLIRADNANIPYQTRIVFNLSQFHVMGVQSDLVTEQVLFAVDPLPNEVAACVPVVSPTATGGQAIFGAQGTDSDIDVRLLPKGNGFAWLGRPALASSVAGHFSATDAIPVRDGAGAIWYIPVSKTRW